MARRALLPGFVRRRPLVSACLAVLLAAFLLLGFARYWITTGPGRDFVVSEIDGRDVAGYGRLRIRGLDGDPLSDFTVKSLEIRDAYGIWLSADNLQMSWSPAALLSGEVSIENLLAREIEVRRQPVRSGEPRPDRKTWSVRLERAEVERLRIAEGVAGPEAELSVFARFLNERNGTIDAELRVAPLTGAGDRIVARILRNGDDEFDVKIDSTAPAGGVFASLLGLPEGVTGAVTAKAAGNLEDGRGEARMTLDGADKVFISGKIERSVLDAGIRLNAGALPISPSLAQFLGPAAEADVTMTFAKDGRAFRVNSRLSSGTVNLEGELHQRRTELKTPVRLKAQLNTLAPYWSGARSLNLDGALSPASNGITYDGQLDLVLLPVSKLPFRSVSGPVTVALKPDRMPFTGDVTIREAFAATEGLASVIGDAVKVSGNGVYERGSRRILLDAIEVTHESGQLQVLGEANAGSGALNVSGKLTQALGALPGGFGGSASGLFEAKGSFRDFELGLNLALNDLETRLEPVRALTDGDGTLRTIVRIRPSSGDIRRADVKLPGVQGDVSGQFYGPGSPRLDLSARQLVAMGVSGGELDLGGLRAKLERRSGVYHLKGSASGGRASFNGQTVEALETKADISISNGNFTGPVALSGLSDNQPASLSFVVDRTPDVTRFNAVRGQTGAVGVSGSAALKADGELEADIDTRAAGLQVAGLTIGNAVFKGRLTQAPGSPLSIGGDFEASNLSAGSRIKIDNVTGTVETADDAYRIAGRLTDQKPRANSDVSFSGRVAAGNPSSGAISVSGTWLGLPIATESDIRWTSGSAPSVEADVRLLGGRLQANLQPGNTATRSSVTLQDISAAPLLAALGLPEIDAIVSGRASGRFHGASPEGVLQVSASSPVSGLTSRIDFGLTGRFDGSDLSLAGEAAFGPELSATAAARLPIETSANGLATLHRGRPLEARLDVGGDLKSLRLIALAYGHDIGGALKSHTAISGTLNRPVVDLEATLSGGRYEYGAAGLSLKDVALEAVYRGKALKVTGTAAGTQGGKLELDGKLAEAETGVTVKLDRLLVYDRLDDQARMSGDAHLTERPTDRMLAGSLHVNDARFNLENFASTSIRTLNVRWNREDTLAPRQTLLNKPIRFDLKVSADRNVVVTGRGLDSEWGANIVVGGRPDAVSLNGRANLVRGSLELARRPFVFDTGKITFDGPLAASRFELSAKRELDGFSVRADVGGAAAKPTIKLTSTPSLPEDEILSRMLFGRSSVDLTAFEAAELAGSIARLAGGASRLDPLGAIRDSLGVDRLRFGVDGAGQAELGVGQYVAPDVYVEVTTQGAAGNSVEVEWEPRPQVSVSSQTSTTGESRVSLRWKKDY